MGILSNFIGGAAEAGGNILQRQRESDADLQKQQQYAKYNDDLARARELTTMELRKQYEREKIAYENSPEYLAMTATTEETKATNALNTRAKLAPKAGEVAKAEFEAGAPTRKAAQAEKQEFMLAEFRAKSVEELRADIERGNNKEYLRGVSNEAAAKRDPNAAAVSGIELKLKQLALKEKEAEAKLPPAVKGSIAAIQKQADAISAAVTKAELEGTASPEAVTKYQARLSELNGQISKLYAPYLDDKAPKPADAGGLDKDLAARIAALSASKGKPAGQEKPAAGAATQKPAESAPPRDQGTRNPYVDSKGRPIANAPTGSGESAWDTTVKPGIVGAVNSVNQAGANGTKTYLAEKIARKEPLSPSEQVRAKQFGLVK